MDQLDRARLVAACRDEIKQSRRTSQHMTPSGPRAGWDARDDGAEYGTPGYRNSRRRMERVRTRSRFQRPRRGEGGDAYIRRTAEGGDASFGDAAARYDLRRPRGARPAPIWDDGYSAYDGAAERARLNARKPRR